jgi:hypothetical protein
MQEALTPQEIQARVKRNYLERLALRVRKLRQMSSARNWEKLRIVCQQLTQSADEFGFPEISKCASEVLAALPNSSVPIPYRDSRRATLDHPQVREALNQLYLMVDSILTLNDIPREAT